jgi:cysteine desulfurase/selenocysteine lyase
MLSTIKNHFTLLKNSPELAYLDAAATTQTPEPELIAMDEYYRTYRANIERGIYDLSAEATEHYEAARANIASFINAKPTEIIFTSGTTAGLNLIAQGLRNHITKRQSIVLTRYEHHANLIPWQELARASGAELRFIELTPGYELDRVSAERLIDSSTAIVSIAATANSIGTKTPLATINTLAKKVGARVVVDAAQSSAHSPIDMQKLDVDALVFSGHKMYGPTGTGIVYGKKDFLESLDPSMFGGGMIEEVAYDHATWRPLPQRFEPGTPNIAGVIGLSAAVDFIKQIGWETLQTHEQELVRYFFEKKPDFVMIHGPGYSVDRSTVISFSVDEIHPHDLAELLNERQIAVRAGHHCAMPLMNRLKLPGTVRVSFGMYNTTEDIDRLFTALTTARAVFKK